MTNNTLFRRITTLLNFTDNELLDIFSHTGCTISKEHLLNYFKPVDDENHAQMLDMEFSNFLNGLIIHKRGKKDGPQHQVEQELNNGLIFNKLKIALSLQADEVIAIIGLGGITLGKYELSAFFRNVNHKHYRQCSDEILSTFLKGLALKFNR